MKALLLAAGLGSRLGEVTKTLPKALVTVGNEPIIDFCIKRLYEIGVTDIVINIHHKANLIREHFALKKYSVKLDLSEESKLLGTCGTLKKHFNALADDDFIVMHADNFFTGSLHQLIKDHSNRNSGDCGTMATFISSNPRNCGILELNEDKTIKSYFEKIQNPPGNLANAAIYIFTPRIERVLDELSGDVLDIGRDLIPRISSRLSTSHLGKEFVDIGTPDGLAQARALFSDANRNF